MIVYSNKSISVRKCANPRTRVGALTGLQKPLGRGAVLRSNYTIPVDPVFLWHFVLLSLKTYSLYHEKLFIQKLKVISCQVLNNFFSASDIMEAVRGRFCFYRYECKVVRYKLDCCKVGIGQKVQCNRLAFRVLTQDRRIQGGHSTTRKLISSQIFRCI